MAKAEIIIGECGGGGDTFPTIPSGTEFTIYGTRVTDVTSNGYVTKDGITYIELEGKLNLTTSSSSTDWLLCETNIDITSKKIQEEYIIDNFHSNLIAIGMWANGQIKVFTKASSDTYSSVPFRFRAMIYS